MTNFSGLLRFLAKQISEKDLEDTAIDFLKKNPYPDDAKVHKYAEKSGIKVDDFEKVLYRMATKFMKFWTGGRANKKGFTVKDADPKQLKRGIKIEYEHTDNEDDVSTEIAQRITLDHLSENPKYYAVKDDAKIEELVIPKDEI